MKTKNKILIFSFCFLLIVSIGLTTIDYKKNIEVKNPYDSICTQNYSYLKGIDFKIDDNLLKYIGKENLKERCTKWQEGL